MILIVTFLPVGQVAFQILVFVLPNVALIGFREGVIEEYQPELTAPLYPWTQLFGIASGLVVLARMALVPVRGRDGDRPALARLVHAVHRLVEAVDCTAVMVQTGEGNRGGLVKRLVLDRLFG